MISRIVVHTVYVIIIIIMCYFIVSCIPVLIILYLTKINNNNNNNASKHTYTCITQLKLTILKGCLGTFEQNGSCILPHQCDAQQAVHLAQCLSFTNTHLHGKPLT